MNQPLAARAVAAIALVLAAAAHAADDAAMQRMQQQIDELKAANERQAGEIKDLKEQQGDKWLSEARATQIRGVVADVLADSQSRASLQSADATAGYDRNFFIASADGNFRLNIEGQMQARFAFNTVPASSLPPASRDRTNLRNEYGFEFRRIRMNFFGHVFDPSWTYRIQWAYERDGENSGRPLAFEDAFIQKALGGGWYVRAGQWKNFLNYEEIASSRTQQFVERSAVNQYFSTQFVQGAMLGWESEQYRVYAAYIDGGANRNIGVISNTGNATQWAFDGRVEWKLAGAWGQFRDMQGWHGSDFAVMLGAAANVQRAGGNPPPGRVTVGNGNLPNLTGMGTVNDQVSLVTYTADANVRGDGWSGWAAFLGNSVYDGGRIARSVRVEGTNSYGVVVQGGVFLTNAVELIARYEGLWVDSDNDNPTIANPLVAQSLNIVTLGVNWYFHQNAVKLTLDGGWAMNPVRFNQGLYGQSLGGADWRASQTGKGVGETVVRCQLQLLF